MFTSCKCSYKTLLHHKRFTIRYLLYQKRRYSDLRFYDVQLIGRTSTVINETKNLPSSNHLHKNTERRMIKNNTYRPSKFERRDQLPSVGVWKRERIFAEYLTGRVAKRARTGTRHVALVFLKAQPKKRLARHCTSARDRRSCTSAAAIAVWQFT